MQVFFRSTNNGRRLDPIDVPDETTLGEFLSRFAPDETLEGVSIRVNGCSAGLGYRLSSRDRIDIVADRVKLKVRSESLPALAGFATRRPGVRRVGLLSRKDRGKKRRESVIELMDRYAESIPPEIQAEMQQQLMRGLDANRSSYRKLFP